MPMIATVIINSISVKPVEFRLMVNVLVLSPGPGKSCASSQFQLAILPSMAVSGEGKLPLFPGSRIVLRKIHGRTLRREAGNAPQMGSRQAFRPRIL
jgi:hypothetical protein